MVLIKGGYLVDPGNKREGVFDILIADGKVIKIEKEINQDAERLINAQGKFILPGLIDMHCHLREPGREDEETLLSGSWAGIRGGFTTLCCMPNTQPPIDNQGVVEYIYNENRKIGLIDIFPIGAITKNREGKELTEIGELKRAGVVAISDDGNCVMDSEVMRRAMEYSKMFDLLVISHCEDINLSCGGLMNEGYISSILGLKGIPRQAETIMVARDLELARLTQARLHIAHVSTKEAVELIRQAKKEGIKVTSETCPHYFSLNEETILGYNTNCKVNPPLRTQEDIEAIKEGLRDGTIDVIATDHAPHTDFEKDTEFEQASFGIIGLETALGITLKELVETKIITLSQLVERMVLYPAKIVGMEKGTIDIGEPAEFIILDLHKSWKVEKEKIVSKSKNTPFLNWTLPGVIEYVFAKGKMVLGNTN
ncbi:MAG: dihydroorotase [Candidatus Omnitrophica bacterium]|nr:dihydroorotase [Candidatus Omnitrophota bacterium]MCM8798523.1 dihydroorotase [Candidatus Omnitrophota bacterium]